MLDQVQDEVLLLALQTGQSVIQVAGQGVWVESVVVVTVNLFLHHLFLLGPHLFGFQAVQLFAQLGILLD